MNFIKRHKFDIVLVILCIVAELILSNWSAFTLMLSGCEKVSLNLNDAVITKGADSAVQNKSNIYLNGGIVEFQDINTEMKNISLTLGGADNYIPVYVSFTDENFAYEDGYDYQTSCVKVLAYDDEKSCIKLSSLGEVKNLRLDFKSESVTISDVEINSPPAFGFRIFRCCVLIFLCFAIKYRLWEIKYKKGYHSHYTAIIAIAVCLITVLVYTYVTSNDPSSAILVKYPVDNISSADQYVQLFDAFKHGRLNLDIDYDTAAFDSLQNVYDRSERNISGLHGDFWDRAYYNGKFYSYFGAAPIFTVYFPVYLLTGCIPSASFASLILCIYCVIFISLLYALILNKFCKQVPLLLALFGQIALLMTSAIFPLMAENLFYYMAILSGIGCVSAFLYFLLKAYYADEKKSRILFLVLTGISVVFIVASRPTMLIYTLTAAVPAIFVFTNKSETVKDKITYLISIGTPVVVGAVLIMIYNYLRFDSPLEFGFNYQLTVSIAKANTVTLSMIPAAIYHYFIQQPKVIGSFPYIELKGYSLDYYTRYNYIGRNMGVLNYPLILGNFLYPFADNKKNKFKRYFIASLIASALLLSFADMCKAGAHYRYTADILMPLALSALVIIFNVIAKIERVSYKCYKWSYVLVVFTMAVTVVLGYLLIFANENKTLLESPQLVRLLKYL